MFMTGVLCTVYGAQVYLRIGLLDLVILQKSAFLKQNKFIPVSLISF